MRKLLFLTVFLVAGLAPVSMAHADPGQNSTDNDVVIQNAVSDIASQLNGKQTRLQVKSQRTSGPWQFLWATMQEPNGDPIDYRGTAKEAAAAHGAASANYVALFRRDADGAWNKVVSRVGPTDVAWVGWDKQYGAPSDLFPAGIR